MLSVSRQAVSKWESGEGYPETEKLLLLSEKLHISLDYLMSREAVDLEKEAQAVKPKNYTGKISIRTHDKKSIVTCHKVTSSKILCPKRGEPEYLLLGVDRITFLGEHTTILGWYADEAAIMKELDEIMEALCKGMPVYELRYVTKYGK